MKEGEILNPQQLKERAIRFYSRYGKEVEHIKDLLDIKLKQLALAYTIQHKLPEEAVIIKTRTKSIDSFFKKMKLKEWPQFYLPTEVITDLIGARIICWFLDDCYGILSYIEQANGLEVIKSSIEDYIKNPKDSGYRSLHLLANIPYDRIQQIGTQMKLSPDKMIAEIQIRTKLQDAWGDVTHEFHYKAKNLGIIEPTYESLLADISNRLATEDQTLIKFRNVYQNLADKKLKEGKREGFKDQA